MLPMKLLETLRSYPEASDYFFKLTFNFVLFEVFRKDKIAYLQHNTDYNRCSARLTSLPEHCPKRTIAKTFTIKALTVSHFELFPTSSLNFKICCLTNIKMNN